MMDIDRYDPRRQSLAFGPEARGRGYYDGPLGFSRDRQALSHEPPARGAFAGVGPKGYRRLDQRIHEDVCDWLTAHPAVDASDVTVHVEGGEVTLSGTVAARWEKRLVEDVADHVRGVRDVHNELRIRR